jgi:hypothetical protein
MDYVIGYGTLLSRWSARVTLGREPAAPRRLAPVVVHGYRRLFNARPAKYESSRRLNGPPIERGAMNVEPAEGGRFNGLAISVTRDELVALDVREESYARVRVDASPFGRAGQTFRAFTYMVPLHSHRLCRSIDELLPRWLDICLARAGCLELGREFLDMYDETTYLADGETLMVEHYRRRVPMFDRLTLEAHV